MYTSESESDLIEIWYYVSQQEREETRSDNLIKEIKQTVFQLSQFPYMGKERPEISKDLYFFSSGNYSIFYRITQNDIAIIRILHSSRDVSKIFSL